MGLPTTVYLSTSPSRGMTLQKAVLWFHTWMCYQSMRALVTGSLQSLNWNSGITDSAKIRSKGPIINQ